MKLPGNRLRMSSGEVRHFGSATKRANFERVAEAYKHGWKPRYSKRQLSAHHSSNAHKEISHGGRTLKHVSASK